MSGNKTLLKWEEWYKQRKKDFNEILWQGKREKTGMTSRSLIDIWEVLEK